MMHSSPSVVQEDHLSNTSTSSSTYDEFLEIEELMNNSDGKKEHGRRSRTLLQSLSLCFQWLDLPFGNTGGIVLVSILVVFVFMSSSRSTPLSSTTSSSALTTSKCGDPLQPRIRGEEGHNSREQFLRTHQRNIQLATEAQVTPVDVVFLGDSIIEGWMGTVYGEMKTPVKAEVFREFFSKDTGGDLNGLALGIAGDQSPNLLWRLIHGELPEHLQPKVFWVLIGTNDFGHGDCSPDMVVAGILRVVDELRTRRPDSVVVINSLLPRRDRQAVTEVIFDGNNSNIFSIWNSIKIVNEKLRNYCEEEQKKNLGNKVMYFDATDIFLSTNKDGMDYIVAELMPDFLHPNGNGYYAWAKRITATLHTIP